MEYIERANETFRIDSKEKAMWVFERIAELNEEIAANKELANTQIEKANKWLEKENTPLLNKVEGFESLVKQFYREEKEKDPKFKLSTPTGKIVSRKVKTWFYEDEQALMDYCNVNEIDAIRVKEELDKTSLKKLFKDGVNAETGEVLPFVRVEENENITIKVEA